jgi:hypothetical protein
MPRDFIHADLGLRVYGDQCVVIERMPGVDGWVEDGQRFPLPLPEGFDSVHAIPVSQLALAFTMYEINNPGSELRELLTAKPTALRGA